MWREVIGAEPEAAPAYSRDWSEPQGEERLWQAARRHLRAKSRTAEAPGAGGNYLDDLNPESFAVLKDCQLEPALANAPVGGTLQFERLGYYCADPDGTPEHPIFNRTVGLRDTWAKVQRQQASDQQTTAKKKG